MGEPSISESKNSGHFAGKVYGASESDSPANKSTFDPNRHYQTEVTILEPFSIIPTTTEQPEPTQRHNDDPPETFFDAREIELIFSDADDLEGKGNSDDPIKAIIVCCTICWVLIGYVALMSTNVDCGDDKYPTYLNRLILVYWILMVVGIPLLRLLTIELHNRGSLKGNIKILYVAIMTGIFLIVNTAFIWIMCYLLSKQTCYAVDYKKMPPEVRDPKEYARNMMITFIVGAVLMYGVMAWIAYLALSD